MFFAEFKNRLSLNDSFVIETTLSGKYLVNYIKQAKELNFYVVLIYLFLENTDSTINRVKNRVLNGGHHIPQDDIIRRYYRSKNLFWNTHKEMVDEWMLYYNSNEIFEEIADSSIVYDSKKLNEFKEE